MKTRRAILVLMPTVAISAASFAQPANVHYQDGLVSVECTNASLEQVFRQIEAQAGIELILEDSVKSKRLTASLTAEPLQLAVQRLLDGAEVNYVVLMDTANWSRVSKVFVGAGGGSASRGGALPPRAPVRPPAPVEPVEDDYDDFDNMEDDEFDEFGDLEEDPDAMDAEMPPDAPPPAATDPGYLPPPQSFPRSPFAPGPGASPYGVPAPFDPGGAGGTTQPGNSNQGNPPPPATFPFTDQYGQPIPVPPEMQQQRRQQKEKK